MDDRPTPWYWKLRFWLAMDVLLPIIYFLIEDKPQFCDLADKCPREPGPFLEMTVREKLEQEYTRIVWALVMCAGGVIRVPQIVLHDSNLMGVLSKEVDPRTNETIFTAKDHD